MSDPVHHAFAAQGAPTTEDLEARREFANNIPMLRTLGIEVLALEPGKSQLRMPFRTEMTQPAGILHGGAIAALADSGVAQALVATVPLGTQFTTIELKINYLRPVSEGTLWAHSELLHVGRRTALGEVTLTNDAGKLVAKAMMTYMLMRPEE